MMITMEAVSARDSVALLLRRAAATDWIELNRTQVMKLLYFIDLAAVVEVGYPITSLDWHWDKFGPFDAAVLGALDELVEERILITRTLEHDVGTEQRYSVNQLNGDAPRVDESVMDRFDDVIRDHHGETGKSLSSQSYKTPPMRLAQSVGERGDELDLYVETSVGEAADIYLAAMREPIGDADDVSILEISRFILSTRVDFW